MEWMEDSTIILMMVHRIWYRTVLSISHQCIYANNWQRCVTGPQPSTNNKETKQCVSVNRRRCGEEESKKKSAAAADSNKIIKLQNVFDRTRLVLHVIHRYFIVCCAFFLSLQLGSVVFAAIFFSLALRWASRLECGCYFLFMFNLWPIFILGFFFVVSLEIGIFHSTINSGVWNFPIYLHRNSCQVNLATQNFKQVHLKLQEINAKCRINGTLRESNLSVSI